MTTAADIHGDLAALQWQIELGADEAILDAPVDRFALPQTLARPDPKAPQATAPGRAQVAPPAADAPQPAAPAGPDPVVVARGLAAGATDLAALSAAMEGFEHCELKRYARSFVFSDGNPAARVMVIGEAPGRDEDIQGRPFVGRAGKLLDRMFAAIGLSREAEVPDRALYITNILPWRPPQNRDPEREEIAMMMPFVARHVELADPDFLVLMGNFACQGVLGRRGITRLRGQWAEALDRPALPMFHPAFLLRNPIKKRDAWSDLLSLAARLEA